MSKETIHTKKYGPIQARVYGQTLEQNPTTNKNVWVGYIRKDSKKIRVHEIYNPKTHQYVWVSTWDYPENNYLAVQQPTPIRSVTVYHYQIAVDYKPYSGIKVRFARNNDKIGKVYNVNSESRGKRINKLLGLLETHPDFNNAIPTCGKDCLFVSYMRKSEE